MTNIRQKINNMTLDKDFVLLRDAGIVSDFGNLTALGRRVLCDMLFLDNRDRIIEAVRQAQEEGTESTNQ